MKTEIKFNYKKYNKNCKQKKIFKQVQNKKNKQLQKFKCMNIVLKKNKKNYIKKIKKFDLNNKK